MRILALTNLYPNPWQPQRAAFNRRQLRFLNAMHPVRVIAPVTWTDELQARRLERSKLPPRRQMVLDGITVDHPRIYHVPGMLRGMYGRFYYWSVRKTFHRICREFNPTIVYAPWIYPDGWAAVQLAKEFALPVVLKAHGSDILMLGKHSGRRPGTIQALKEASGIVAVSRDLATKMIELGANEHMTRVVYDGVEPDLFHPGSKSIARAKVGIICNEPVLLFIGNLVRVKSVETLLQAAGLMHRRGIPFQLHIIGEGPLRNNLIAQARRCGIHGRVHWHGSMSHSLLPDWYRAADVFVLPSLSEGVPNVLLEAAACNTPWIATRVGGIPEIAHFGASHLVEPEAAEELANTILAVLRMPPSHGSRPRCPKETAEELTAFFLETQDRFDAFHNVVLPLNTHQAQSA